jgi:hypothetical protein
MKTTPGTRWAWIIALTLMALGAIPATGYAQDTGTRTPVPHDQILSINPFLILAEWINIDFERRLNDKSTLAFTGGWINVDDGEYVSGAVAWRYYPQEAALSGF